MTFSNDTAAELATLRQQVADLSCEVAELTSFRQRVAELEALNAAHLTNDEGGSPRSMLALVLDHLPFRIGWKDRQSVYLGCNERFAHHLGLAHPHEIVGKTNYDLSPPNIAEAYRAADQLIMDRGVPELDFEERNHKEDGSLGWLLTSKIPLRGDDGTVVGILVITEDITDRKRAEEARQVHQAEMIEMQQGEIRELATPLIPLADEVVIMPLVGRINSQRTQQVLESLLDGIVAHQAVYAILDLTGVKVVDTQVAQGLLQVAKAAKLLGTQIILTGISAEIALMFVLLQADLSGIVTRANLQRGIAYALQPVN